MSNPKRIGGSFAPPINDETLEKYKSLAEACENAPCKKYMLELANMLEVFNETPESTQAGSPHPSGRGTIVPLEDAELERISDVVPYMHECDMIGQQFEALEGETRNAAFHLLWFARELAAEREPITCDKL